MVYCRTTPALPLGTSSEIGGLTSFNLAGASLGIILEPADAHTDNLWGILSRSIL